MERKGKEVPVRINLASRISYDGIAGDPLQVITTGTLTPADKAYLLRYIEAQEDEATGEVIEEEVLLELKKDQVTMNRSGDYRNTMLFRRNKRFETSYQTPFGDLPMAIYSRDVQCDLGTRKGKVRLRYELSMQGAYASTNELSLEYVAQ